LERLLHETSNLDGPWINRESRRKTGHRGFVGGEFVKIVVATRSAGWSQRPIINLKFGTSYRGIKAVGSPWRQRKVRCFGCAFFRSASRQGRASCSQGQSLNESTAIPKDRLRHDRRFRQRVTQGVWNIHG